ncbi:MAG: GNAT family N-acetyltransferase [Patescibacteria group bacterium]
MAESPITNESTLIPPVIQKLKSEVVRDNQTGITLTPFNGSEVDKYKEWFSDPEVLKFLHPNTPFTKDPSKKVSVEEFIRYICEDPGSAYFRIEHPTYGFVGHISLSSINLNNMSFSEAYVIGEKQHWGKGIMTTVDTMILNRAKGLGFKTAKAIAISDNTASIKILTKQFGEGIREGNHINFTKAL